jgi:DNA polymerase-3 subunit gamma/tau
VPADADAHADADADADAGSAADADRATPPTQIPPTPAAAPPGDPLPPTHPAPAPTDGTLPTRDDLVEAWGDRVIGRLRPKAKALFQAGRFVGVSDGRALFGLPNETHRARCEEMRPEVESALAEQFGRPVPLTLVVDGAADPAAGGPTADDGPPTPPSRAERPRPRPPAPPHATQHPTPTPVASGPLTASPPPVDAGAIGRDLRDDGLGGGDGGSDGDLDDFDTDGLEVADIDNSAESRVLKAFPGAEEVS